MTARALLAAVAIGLLGTACAGAETDGPPEINYGRDICVQCNMIISEIGHAAAYRLEDGTEKKFDGVGEMVLHGREHGELDHAEAWVHDFWSEEWVRAEEARYVPTLAIGSPMGHGIFAFATAERAVDFAAEVDGDVIDWAAVLQLPIGNGLVGDIHEGSQQTDMTPHSEHGSGSDETEEQG